MVIGKNGQQGANRCTLRTSICPPGVAPGLQFFSAVSSTPFPSKFSIRLSRFAEPTAAAQWIQSSSETAFPGPSSSFLSLASRSGASTRRAIHFFIFILEESTSVDQESRDLRFRQTNRAMVSDVWVKLTRN